MLSYVFLLFVHVFLTLSMYSYCCLRILIFRPCILIVVYVFLFYVHVFLLLSTYSYCSSMYSYCCLCILIVVYVFLDAATLTEVFPCFFLGYLCKCQGNTSQDGARPALFQNCCVVLCIVYFVLFYVLIVCNCVLPPGDNPIAVKYIISYHKCFHPLHFHNRKPDAVQISSAHSRLGQVPLKVTDMLGYTIHTEHS